MSKLLLFFRQASDRRADAEAARRREEREVREMNDKREREERGIWRVKMRPQLKRDATKRREKAQADLEERERVRTESRRRYEENRKRTAKKLARATKK